MQIELNGQPREIPDACTIADLLASLQLDGKAGVGVERNGEFVPPAEHAQRVLQAGDRVEVVRMIGGG